MAINLAAKYSDKIAGMYTVGSLVADKTSSEWDFSGVKTVKIYTPQTVEPVDYTRDGTNRFGTPVEMADTVQELTMTQDKSYSIIIDKGNNNEQMLVKNAGKMLKLQTNEKVVPMVDKYALSRYCALAGTVAGITKPTKTTIIADIGDACKVLDDACVPPGKPLPLCNRRDVQPDSPVDRVFGYRVTRRRGAGKGNRRRCVRRKNRKGSGELSAGGGVLPFSA